MEQDVALGKRIRTWRKKSGRTMSDLAQAVGVTQGALSRIETGSRGTSAAFVAAVAAELGLTMAEFYGPLPE